MNLFDLFAKITLDTSEYEEGMEESEQKAEGFASKLKKGLGTAAKVGAAAVGAVTTAAVAVGAAMVKGAGEAAAYGDNIDKMSQKMGISATAYQEWDAIMQHSGSSIDSLQRGMMTLSKAAETGSDAFARLGLSQEDVASMNQEELFAATIKGLQGMEEGSERAVLAQQLLGGAAKELGPLLNTSAEDTEAMRKRVHELGGVMSEEAVKSAAAYQDALQDMTTSIDGLKRGLFTTFMPGITAVMGGLTDLFSGGSGGGVGKITEGIGSIVTKLSENIPKVVEVGGQIVRGLLDAISQNLPQIAAEGSRILIEFAAGIVSNLPELVRTGLEIIVQLATSIADAIPELMPTIVDVVLSIVDMLTNPDNITRFIEAAVTLMVALAGGLVQAVPELIAHIPEIIQNLLTALIEAAPLLVNAGIELINKLIEGIGKSIGKLKEVFNFKWELPKLKLPHFSIGEGPTVLGIKLPKINVEWYKKAYETPYLFDTPTVVGTKGFGDGPGGEMVYGRDALMNDIRQAVGGLLNEPINIVVQSVLDGRVIGETAYQYNLQRARANG